MLLRRRFHEVNGARETSLGESAEHEEVAG